MIPLLYQLSYSAADARRYIGPATDRVKLAVPGASRRSARRASDATSGRATNLSARPA